MVCSSSPSHSDGPSKALSPSMVPPGAFGPLIDTVKADFDFSISWEASSYGYLGEKLANLTSKILQESINVGAVNLRTIENSVRRLIVPASLLEHALITAKKENEWYQESDSLSSQWQSRHMQFLQELMIYIGSVVRDDEDPSLDRKLASTATVQAEKLETLDCAEQMDRKVSALEECTNYLTSIMEFITTDIVEAVYTESCTSGLESVMAENVRNAIEASEELSAIFA